MSSISPIRVESAPFVQQSSAPRAEKPSDVPENLFAPPGVFTRLTAILQTYRPSDAPRPEVVAKGKELAASADFPSVADLSQVAKEFVGDFKA